MLEKNIKISNQAINTLNQNILVSASAGAGKTKLLIDRLIKRIMIDRVDVSNILALTFTDAAASEMKHRLQKEITKKLSEKDDIFLRKQLSLIETSSISTIHSFCLSVVKDYGYVLNLNPKLTQNLLDEATKTLLIEQCLDRVIQNAIKYGDDNFLKLSQTLCPRAENLDPLRKAIQNVVHVRNAKVDPQAWDHEVLEYYKPIKEFNELPADIITLLKEDYMIKINKLHNIVNNIINDCGVALEDNVEVWREISNHLTVSFDMVAKTKFDDAHRRIQSLGVLKTKTIKDYDSYNELRTKFNNQLKSLIEEQFSERDLLLDLYNQKPLVEWLLKLAKDMMDAFIEVKQIKKTMDFDDMEKFALQILNDPHFNIDKVYQSVFSDVLVDEFQDTNDIQHAIISKVSRSDNVFRVGDIKQSIYRFRNAKPQLMRDLIQDKESQDLVLNLPNNFRSGENIVAFNNFVFDLMMNIPTFEDEYKENDHVAIGLERQKNSPFPVELDVIDVILENEAIQEAIEFSDEDVKDVVELEETKQEGKLKARHIAKRILEFKEQGYDFKDMCILVRTHATKTPIKEIFDEVAIPYFIDSKSGFFQSQPVQDVLAYLRVLSNPDDLISLTGLLSSAFFNASFDELATASIMRRDQKITLHKAYTMMFPQFMEEIEQTKGLINSLRLSEILMIIYQKNDFYHSQCDDQAKINLDYLIEKALLYEQNNEHGITRFLSIVEHLQDEVSSEAFSIGSDDDVVKVMTIHQSKGLQFPIVFFWTNNYNKDLSAKDAVIVDPNLGIGMHTIQLPYRFKKKNILRSAIEFNSMKQELQEQIRLLYVALTRAESRMILVATKSKERLDLPIDNYLIYEKRGNAHWLSSIFTQHTQEFMQLNYVAPVDALYFKPNVEIESKPLEKRAKLETTKPIKNRFTFIPSLDFTQSLKATERGSIIHNALSTLIMNNWDSTSIESFKNLSTSQLQQIHRFINHPFTHELKPFRAESEYPLIMHYQGKYQQVIIDLLVDTHEKNIIIDFKSDKISSEAELIDRYYDQLMGYVHAIQQVYEHKPIEAYIYSLQLDRYIRIH